MKTLFIIIGTVSLLLGVVGIILPLLPTTPFLLLSAALYMRSSPRLYTWLVSSKHLGQYIRMYNADKSIPTRVKIFTLSLLWASLLYCILFVAQDRLWIILLLLAVGVGVTWHILSMKSRKEQ